MMCYDYIYVLSPWAQLEDLLGGGAKVKWMQMRGAGGREPPVGIFFI